MNSFIVSLFTVSAHFSGHRLPFAVVSHVTLSSAQLTLEPSRSSNRREVQDMVRTRSARLCSVPVVSVMVSVVVIG